MYKCMCLSDVIIKNLLIYLLTFLRTDCIIPATGLVEVDGDGNDGTTLSAVCELHLHFYHTTRWSLAGWLARSYISINAIVSSQVAARATAAAGSKEFMRRRSWAACDVNAEGEWEK